MLEKSNDILTLVSLQNLSSKFNPLTKQVLVNAKSYHKALLATSSAARGYIESIGKLGHDCKTHASSGTEEIGQSIYRVAEAYKEIQIKFEECTKAIFTEVILPLEQKLDTELKACVAEQRKYHQGHKEVTGPYTKAVAALEKFKKKNQSKGIFDAEKEAP
ncbi:brain-specific angiogenesis inhibitor 1-associated protein 2, partial [Biomphalaria glabrata]